MSTNDGALPVQNSVGTEYLGGGILFGGVEYDQMCMSSFLIIPIISLYSWKETLINGSFCSK